VPNVCGYTVEDAGQLDAVISSGFTIKEGGTKPSDQYEAGVILSQDPTAESTTKSNLVITVITSSGKDSGQMIDVVGEEARNAERVLLKDLKNRYNLTIETQEETSEEVTAGYIISTEPAAGGELEDGDTVTLVVSKGPGQVTIPNFTAMNIDKATKDAAETYGLTVKTVQEASDQPAGTVIRQDISVGSEVDKGSTITLTVSDGSLIKTENTISIDCELPTDRDTVRLVVEVDGKEQYNEAVDCTLGYVSVSLTGSGTQTVTIYWDGVVHAQYPQQFD